MAEKEAVPPLLRKPRALQTYLGERSGADTSLTSTTSERDPVFCRAARGSVRNPDQLRFSVF